MIYHNQTIVISITILITMLITLVRTQCETYYQYYDTLTNTCKPCSVNCIQCYSLDFCLTCVDQYYMNINTNLCQPCQYGCSACTSATSCGTCRQGLYMNGDGACITCPIGVKSCTIAVVEVCQDGYFMLGSICAGCFQNCRQCVDFATCVQCMSGHYLTDDTTQCLPCSSNCLICTSAAACTSCAQGYQVSGSGACQRPDCSAVSQFCVKCSFGMCQQCEQGKYVNDNGGCSQGASLLCLQSTGPYHTDCQTSNFGCPAYAQAQKDILYGIQLDICLPIRAATSKQQLYHKSQSNCPSQPCSTIQSYTWNVANMKPFYKLSYYISLKLYNNPVHQLSIAVQESGANKASQAVNVDANKQFSQGLTDTDCANSCQYGVISIQGSIIVSAGASVDLQVSSSTSGITVLEAVVVIGICEVDKCQLCSSSVDCLSCYSPYFLQMIECVTACDPGFYKYGRTCVLDCPSSTYPIRVTYQCTDCQSPCLTCTSQTSCLSCVDGYFLQGNSCVLQCSTPELFTNFTSGNCETCPNPCTQCIIQNSTDLSSNISWQVTCSACRVGYLLIQGSCTYLCPQGSFPNFLQNISQCSQCSIQCTSCYISTNVCSSCQVSYLLNIETSSCDLNYSCPAGYYQDTTYNICLQCHYPCKTCIDNSTQCTSCLKGSLYNNQCPLVCPTGMFVSYLVNSESVCEQCVSPCVTCLSVSYCLSCEVGTFLYEGTCVSQCPLSTLYQLVANNSCMACKPPCSECTSQTQCLSCSTGYLEPSTNTCTLNCNSTSFINNQFTCTLCPLPCNKCYSLTSCMQCQLPHVLSHTQNCITQPQCQTLNMYVQYQYQYITGTPIHISSRCITCTYPCTACSGSPIQCTSCADTYYLVAQLSTCSQQCPLAYYASGVQCLKCDAICLDCDVAVGNCTQCGTGMYLHDHTCIQECPSLYYGDNADSLCKGCQSPCLQCYSVYLCKTCIPSTILYNKVCVNQCPAGTVHNPTTNQCQLCTNNCLTCHTTPSNCTSCPNQLYFHNNQCPSSCPPQFYPDIRSQACQPCISPCIQCSSDIGCLSCIADYYLYTDQCLLECPIGYFKGVSTCQQCNVTICRSCQDNMNDCLACVLPYYYEDGVCVRDCALGNYADQVSRECKGCRYPCLECRNLTMCSACHTNYKMFNNYCYSACPVGYYSTSTDICLPCMPNCQICQSQSVCLKCTTNYYVDNTDQCVQNCATGYYAGFDSLTSYSVCLLCPTQCLSCLQYFECTTCILTLYLFNGLCLDQCPVMHYALATSGNQYACDRCPDNCNRCTNNYSCNQCLNSYMYENLCYVECPATTYMFNAEVCIDCTAPCLECESQFSCVTCLSGYFYFQNYCLVKCPDDVWKYPQNGTCNTHCPYNKYQQMRQCYVVGCGGMMVQLSGYCLQKCPTGYYVDQQQNCQPCQTNPNLCLNLFTGQLQILRSSNLKLSLYFSHPILQPSLPPQLIQVTFTDMNNPSQIIPYSPTDTTITPYSLTIQYGHQQIILYQVSLKIPYLQQLQNQQSINNNLFTKIIYTYNDYGEEQYGQVQVVNVMGLVFVVAVFVCMVVNVVVKSSGYVQLFDFVQFVAAGLYLEVQYPPVLQGYLKNLGYILWTFMPQIANFTPYAASPSKYIEYFVDTSILRSQGLTFIIFLLILLICLIIILINKIKPQYCQKAVKRIRYRHLTDLFSIFVLPLFIFSFHFSNKNNQPADIIISIISISLCVSYVSLITYKLITVKNYAQIPGLTGDMQDVQSTLGKLYTPFAFIRKMIFGMILCIQPQSPISTLTILLVLTVLIMVCLVFYQPFENIITDYVCIFMEVCLVCYIVMIIVFGLNAVVGSAAHTLGIVTIVFNMLGIITGLVWLMYLTFKAIQKFHISLKSEQKEVENKIQKSEQKGESHNQNGQQSIYSHPNPNIIKVTQKRPSGTGTSMMNQEGYEDQQTGHALIKGNQARNWEINENVDNEHDHQEFRHWNASEEGGSQDQDSVNPPRFLMKIDRAN